jgi:hypothetical protein
MAKTKTNQQHNQDTQHNQSNLEYTDKRTGIVYTNIGRTMPVSTGDELTQKSHLDAFIPAAFLKTYFVSQKFE